MAVRTPVLYLIQEIIPGWDIPFVEGSAEQIVRVGIAAFVAYLLKNTRYKRRS